jgi:hypothetical protein
MANGIPEDFSKAELLRRIEARWGKLQDLLAALVPADWERPLGDGWPVKVHVAHLADWEASLLGLLGKGSRADAMGIPEELWSRHDVDATNQFMADRALALPAWECRDRLEETHARVVEVLEGMTEAELLQPYAHYQPGEVPGSTAPVVGWVVGNTFGHFDEHIGWLEAGLIG